MSRYEKFSVIFLVAGVCFLLFGFLTLAVAPVTMIEKLNPWEGLPTEIPADFSQYYASVEDYQKALVHGRDVYISEACWHCHSQYVRPVSNETLRYGPVSQPGEYQNVLNLPQLFGTRRVGPDLSRESKRHPNDWHFAHLFNPKWVEPQSVMPGYSWYFEIKDKDGKITTADPAVDPTIQIVPKKEAIDLVAYLQWLGNEVTQVGGEYDWGKLTLPPRN